MSTLELESAYLTLTPEIARSGQIVEVEGLGFLANTLVDIQIVLPDGSYLEASILTDAEGKFSSSQKAVPASVLLSTTGVNVSVDDTVTIDGIVYTFKAAPTTVANELRIGEYAAESLDSLKAALNLDSVEGYYGSDTELHPTVKGGIVTSSSLQIVAKDSGTDGNALAVSTTADELSFASATLVGGAEATEQKLLGFSSSRSGMVRVTATDGTNTVIDNLSVWEG